ncbi:hypothetical protein [Streptomyces sp. NPDC055210]
MRKTTTAMQAAVVTMLVAKRPALDKLPVIWELRADGTIEVGSVHPSEPADIAKTAAELTRAMRGASSETYDVPNTEGKGLYRVYRVSAQPSGVRVSFYGQYLLAPDPAAEEAEAA